MNERTQQIISIILGILAFTVLGYALYKGMEKQSSLYLTNEEIVEQVKLCEENGMRGAIHQSGWNYKVIRVQCANHYD
jgi:plastocyanin domain-containing protein